MSAKSLILQASGSTPAWLAVTDVVSETDYGLEVVADTSENVYAIIGHQSQARLIKYNSQGVKQWFKNLGVAVGKGIAKDSSGNIYVVGQSETTKCFVQKFNSSGTLIWQKVIDSGSTDTGMSIKVDTAGNVILVGTSGNAGLLVKLDSAGALVWERYLGDCIVYTVALDSSNNIYVGGNFDGNLFKINSSGTLQWVKKFTLTSQNVEIYSIIIDSLSNIYIGGKITGTSGFIAKLDSSGVFLWKKDILESGNGYLSIVHGMLFKPDGSIIAVMPVYTKCFLVNIGTSGTLLWATRITGMALNSIALYNADSFCGAGGIQDFANTPANNSATAKTFTITLPLNGTVPKTGSYPSSVTYTTTAPSYSDNTTVTVGAGTNVLTNPLTALTYITKNVQTPRMDASGNLLLPGSDFSTNGKASLIYFNSSRVKQWQTTFDTPQANQTDMLTDAVFYGTDIFVIGKTYAKSQTFLAKLNSSGTVVFQQTASTDLETDKELSILVDSSGNVYCAYCRSSFLYVVKSNSSGTKLWVRQIHWVGANVEHNVYSLVFDYLGNIFVLSSTDYEYCPIYKINSSGTRVASKIMPQYTKALTHDSSGNFYISYSDSRWGTLAKINSSFVMQWKVRIADSTASAPSQNATITHLTDSSGNTYLAIREYNRVPSYLLKINSSGALVWQKVIQTTSGSASPVDRMSFTPAGALLLNISNFIVQYPADGSLNTITPANSSGNYVQISSTTNISLTTQTVTAVQDMTPATYADYTSSFTWNAAGKTVGSSEATDIVYTNVADVSTSSYTIAEGTVTNTPTIIG